MAYQPPRSASHPSLWLIKEGTPSTGEYYLILKADQALQLGNKPLFFLELVNLVCSRCFDKTADDIMGLDMDEFDALTLRVYAPIHLWAKTRGIDLTKMRPTR